MKSTRQLQTPCSTPAHKSVLGQFMTPSGVAQFMVSLFPVGSVQTCRLLDAGAGLGALSCAFLERWKAGGFDFKQVEATAFEVDKHLATQLQTTLARYPQTKREVVVGDYITLSTTPRDLFVADTEPTAYTHAILNPPYKKINNASIHRKALRSVGIETVNLYSAFVALALMQLVCGGHLVAIIPRSFCNGPYYRRFREFMLERAAIRRLHLFTSRSKTFKADGVLQENIIIHLERGAAQGDVTVSTSTDGEFSDLRTHEHPFAHIVFPGDTGRFIHVPTTPQPSVMTLSPVARQPLSHLDIKVSTGPVVDFRLKDHLRAMPEAGTVPLIYPCHLKPSGTIWPVSGMKKPNAIVRNHETEKWLYPNGFYCVVRRFSSKEEKRRIVANVIAPDTFGGHDALGFENHLNLFHENGRGLPEPLARGLALFLNTSAVDEYFRQFNGHTQVNATDLKLIKYPNRATLMALGAWAMQQPTLTQDQIDAKLESLAA